MSFVPAVPAMPDLSDFTPSLIPEPARPLVLAPIRLVKIFVSVLVCVVMIVLAVLGVIFCSTLAQIATFGLIVDVLLTLLCAAAVAAMVYGVYVKGGEQIDMLELLEDFCAGELTAAVEVTRIISVKTAGATWNTTRAIANGVTSFNPQEALASGTGAAADVAGAAAAATGQTASMVGGAAEDGAKATVAFAGSAVSGAFSVVTDPRAAALHAVDSVGDAASTAAQAGTSAVNTAVSAADNTLKAAMELNPLSAFEKIIKMVLVICWYLVVFTPPVLIAAGWAVWKLGIHLSGLELIAAGVGFAVLGGAGWWAVNVTAQKQLSYAGVEIVWLQIESAGAALGLGEGFERGCACAEAPGTPTDFDCVTVSLLDDLEPLLPSHMPSISVLV